MGRRVVVVFLCVLIFCLPAVTAYAASGSTTVYITDTGEKYHTSSCSYLRESKNSITLQKAIDRGYTPCSRCDPPRLTSSSSYNSPSYSSSTYEFPTITTTPKIATIDLTDYPTKETATYTPSTSKSSTTYAGSTSKNNEEGNNLGLLIFIFLIICVPPFAWAISNTVKENAEIREEQRRIEREKRDREFAERQHQAAVAKAKREEEERRKEEERKAEEARLAAERSAIIEALNDPQILEYINAPKGDFIASDGLPSSPKGKQKWGDKYTFYVTSTGKAYHKKGCQYSGYLPVNAYEIQEQKVDSVYCRGHIFHKCSMCNPELPDMLWVKRVEEINNDLRKHSIPLDAVNLPEHLFPRR